MTDILKILKGKRGICQHMGWGWAKVEKMILTAGFPAKMIDGVWQSDSELITIWHRWMINGQPKPPKLVQTRGKKILKTK